MGTVLCLESTPCYAVHKLCYVILQVDMAVLKCLIAEKLPEVSQLFKTHYIDLTACCSQWFLCLFVKTLPVEVRLS